MVKGCIVKTESFEILPPDPRAGEEAFRACHSPADRGDAFAQFSLGMLYAGGAGLPADYAESAKWYRLAADQGYASAQNNLSLVYAWG